MIDMAPPEVPINIEPITEEYKEINELYDRLVSKLGGRALETTLVIVDLPESFAKVSSTREITISTAFIKDNNRIDVIAFTLGHELTHYMEDHSGWGQEGMDSRVLEYRADMFGAQMTEALGYDACFAAEMFLRNFKRYGVNIRTYTHPGDAQRYLYLKEKYCN